MTRITLSLVASLAVVVGFNGHISAYEWTTLGPQPDVFSSTSQLPLTSIGGCTTGCDCADVCCDSCCGGWIVDADLLFMSYQQNLTMGPGNGFNNDPSVRLVLGYQNADGLGVRLRFWDYDHSGTLSFGGILGPGGVPTNVDTFNLDAEAFQTVQLTNCTSLELSAGIRYNDFRETVLGTPIGFSFSGFGGIAGIKARRQMLGGSAYANVNSAIIADQLNLLGTPAQFENVSVTQTEIGTGYEWCTYTDSGAKVWLRAGYEWWNWNGYTLGLNNGFAGFVLGGGAQF